MENRAVFQEMTEVTEVSKENTPEFFLLYQQSVLLCLKEQGVIDELQFGLCMDALTL